MYISGNQMTCVKIKLIRDNKKYKRHYPTIKYLETQDMDQSKT